MAHTVQPSQHATSRRSFLRTGLAVGGAGAIGAALVVNGVPAFAEESSGGLTPGDAAILRFLSAAEILETDFWQQYNELGGIQDSEVPGGSGSAAYTAALKVLDGDMDQYIHDNTEDEFTHFTFIKQGGTSLYPSLAQRVTHPEVLRFFLSMGPTETMHFQTWQDKAGNAPPLTDPTNGLVFPNLNAPPFDGEDFNTNLIMPEPTIFLSRKFPPVSIIRPTETEGAAMGALKALTDDGLFIGQSKAFFDLLFSLAAAADAA